jgi:glutamyl-tRNA reductase
MYFTLTGINHHTAPIEMREKAAVNADGLQGALLRLRRHTQHAIILSTCNRSEVYASGIHGEDTASSCAGYMRETLNLPDDSSAPYIYTTSGIGLFRHLCNVSCGLDSMVIGEYEVLGQVRQALAAAEKAGMVDLPLRHLFQSAIRTGRRAREETGISKNALSISSIAVNKALDTIPDIKAAKIIVIGAGEAGRLALRIARSRDISSIVIMSRTEQRAIGLAEQYGARPVSPALLIHEMHDADIVITCAASPHPVLRCKQVSEAISRRPGLPLVILDIAMPRNVEPSVREIPGVHLYNIDDLNDIAGEHRLERETEIKAVERIIGEEVALLTKWGQSYNARPVIKSLVKRAERIRSEQYGRSVKKLPALTGEERQAIDLLTRSIVDKILRAPIMFLKSGDGADGSGVISRLFGLNDENES